ncbi:MAG: hypothetical protein CM1200mP30_30820 [Pseudomonadota bacterium]|nr:MAG: hypothetical protein CM1200mP30_30820 [Pseudomonadota bacterium]
MAERDTHFKFAGNALEKPSFYTPLAELQKKRTDQYLKNNNFSWMEDSTNLSSSYLRNRVRIELIPLLNELTREGLDSRIGDLNEQSSLFRNG